ncbi:MAG: type II secretion system F family protein [Candidatus Omnitrophica bacterium]|nr:type II secretion system F family protein [Candidatus Omnitrophota bacterium]MCB9720651.1 type II secretion system F family protein [Candidatus Omnitrophota bacterium]
MATFKYVAKNQESRSVTGKIAADNKAAVIEELRKRNLIIISINEVKDAVKKKGSFSSKKVKADEIVIFARQLATMVEAGIPIVQGLDALQEQVVQPAFKKTLSTITEDISHGSSLSVAFSKHPAVFDTLFVNMVRVGETGGVLAQVLDRIAMYMEKTLRLRRKVKAALIYPAVVVSMAVIITIVLLVKVVPTFAEIYESFDSELPAMTQMLITVSNILQHYLLYVVGGFMLIGFLLRQWHKTKRGAIVIDGALLKLPIFGDLLRKVAISRFSRTLATLVQSGVPILESLDIVGKTIGNKVLEMTVDDVKNNVRSGESIAPPLAKSGVFPPMVTRMISIGEKSGQLEKMLLKISEFYDDQVDAAVDGLTSIIEPLIIGVLGIVIGFIVVALFMPIMNITQII